ncbi:acyl-CoA dehydrogenase [Aeromicrobium flavum]|uniref:Broad-specificity linear acyl-CoA dehydrogenase FadE5 n=1 Tax=Aeromicrobium flavum TaxID=416568 RepID=A0A512HXS7_9ACTN|nr:acyl-CoA dehydrogenase [Aeromicrobium flavum]GEO90249.1 acyl-CoA dehydrogenase [Aeromicrobium flavum]
MSHYKSNLRDVEFNLFELFDRQSILGTGPFDEVDLDTAKSILSEVERLSREDLAASFVDADRNPPVFDPATHTLTQNPAFKESYQKWIDAEWWRLQLPTELGGQTAPSSLMWAMGEFVLGANPAIWMYGAGPGFSRIVWENGTERDKKIAQIMIDRHWLTTMVLTEPDAGSDVGAGRTKAFQNEDGTWRIEGVKRFITSAVSDLGENTMHLVLARPVGIEGVGGPGTKGLSLFLVPEHHFDVETGELTGERNGAYVTNVEKKMGIKASATCEVTFGDPQLGGPATGWLLGEVHDGINQMFRVIENARMMVGAKAIATLSTGYLNALEYAKERVQGADMTNPAKTAPRVTITHHPDVRRSLLTQKAYAEGLRSLMIYAATFQDEVMVKQASGEDGSLAASINDLLLPLVKGYGSERSWVLLGTESLQTFGGSGFLQEYPLEQYVRDAKIDTLYEGTTAIQGQDLFFRKIVKDQGRALGWLSEQIKSFIDNEAGNGRLKVERDLLATALDDTTAIITAMFTDLMASNPADENGDARNVYKVALNTTRLVYVLGDLVVGWLLLRGAEVAQGQLDGGATGADKSFYEGKVAAASFFAKTVLPRLTSERAMAEAVDLDVMELDEAAF